MRPLLALAAACAGDPAGPKDPPGDPAPTVSFDRFSGETNNNGRLKITFDIPPNATSMQITGQSAQYISVEELYNPDGDRVLFWEDWYYGPRSLTGAVYGNTHVTALSWPPRDVDGPLQPGS